MDCNQHFLTYLPIFQKFRSALILFNGQYLFYVLVSMEEKIIVIYIGTKQKGYGVLNIENAGKNLQKPSPFGERVNNVL